MKLSNEVLNFVPNLPGLKILTPSGYQDFSGVAFMGDKPIYRIVLSNSGYLECTGNHRVYDIDGVEYRADHLEIGTVLSTLEVDPVSVIEVINTGRIEAVFDVIDVAGGHLYFTNKIVSHNCRFVTEDETLIHPLVLATITGIDPEYRIGVMRWYEDPRANHTYALALDPSTGTGGDFAAIQVVDLTTMTQVAEWRDNKTTTQMQIETLRKALLFIHQTLATDPNQIQEPEIYWTIENNGLGEAALVSIEGIGEEHFPGHFISEPRKSGGGGRKGINTNIRSKMTSCIKFKSLVESRRITVKSKALVTELKNFVRGGGSFKAKQGMNDDLVMSMLHIIRLLQIVSNWDDSLAEAFKDSAPEEMMNSDPMAIFF